MGSSFEVMYRSSHALANPPEFSPQIKVPLYSQFRDIPWLTIDLFSLANSGNHSNHRALCAECSSQIQNIIVMISRRVLGVEQC